MKNVLITGGAKGIGKEITNIFLKNNYNVIVLDKENINNSNIVFENIDIKNTSEVEKLKHKYGKIDILINNAAIQYVSPLQNMKYEEIREVIDVNVLGMLNITKTFIEDLKGGLIINIGSVHGNVPRINKIPYDMSKAAMEIFTKEIALECEKDNIRSICIEFGAVDTPMNDNFKNESIKAEAISKQLIMHLLTSEDCAKFVYTLASDDCKYLNGSIIKYDCGRSVK